VNSLITVAVSSGTSSVGNWLTPSKRCTEYQGCSLANDSCTLRIEELGCTGLGVHVEHGYRWIEFAQHPQRLAFECIHSENLSSPRDHISKPCFNIWLRICVSTKAGAPLNHIVNNCSAPSLRQRS
jgi:hypothetical protein